jgi:hypothetical protein
MLGIIAELKNMMSDLVEAKLLIEGHGPGIVLPDAKPNLIRVASYRGSKQLGHEHLSDTFAMPPLIYINALDFGWSHRQQARRRVSPSELSIADEFNAFVAYEGFDPRIGDLGCLNGFAIRAHTMSIHVLARIRRAEGRAKGALCKSR